MMYTVVKDFTDVKDNRHVYRTGDKFPRDGAVADDKRVAELASVNNARGEVLIKVVETAEISPKNNEKPKANTSVNKAKKESKKGRK